MVVVGCDYTKRWLGLPGVVSLFLSGLWQTPKLWKEQKMWKSGPRFHDLFSGVLASLLRVWSWLWGPFLVILDIRRCPCSSCGPDIGGRW